MHRLTIFLLFPLALAVMAVPLPAHAHPAAAGPACPKTASHSLPKSSGGAAPTVFTFGIQGGNIRPWSIKVALDGSVAVSGGASAAQQVPDAKNSLQGLLALADLDGFFSLKKAVGCLGTGVNPDASSRFLSIHTSKGTKRVNEYGSCAATAKFDQLYALLEAAAGYGQ